MVPEENNAAVITVCQEMREPILRKLCLSNRMDISVVAWAIAAEIMFYVSEVVPAQPLSAGIVENSAAQAVSARWEAEADGRSVIPTYTADTAVSSAAYSVPANLQALLESVAV